MLKRHRKSHMHMKRRYRVQCHRGFTLVEMLISVALVLLMMVLFAEVFQMAGGSIGKMRGLAENDQRARTLQTIIKADLDKRSFRWVFPFAANEDTGAPSANMGNRQGYFYISENNPYNDLDDVIQFTVCSTVTIRNSDSNPYYGQALNLGSFAFPNQPDADDGQLVPNNTGLSTVAEIVYFVRNGNLYRRQLLVREPLAIAGTNSQPSDGTMQIPTTNSPFNPLIAPAIVYPAFGPFWNDYDYSAFLGHTGAGFIGAQFPGSNSLDNSGSGTLSLGNPAIRFGFSPANIPGVLHAGRPKEFLADTANLAANTANLSDFIGRFTLQECSNTSFVYPQNVSAAVGGSGIPMDPSVTLSIDSTDPNNPVVSGFGNGLRRGEDLLMANVHSFDIQVWDELAQRFVNMGDPALTSGLGLGCADYAYGNRYAMGLGTPPSPTYGPRLTENPVPGTPNAPPYATNVVFDTWHPKIDLETGNDVAPFLMSGQNAFDDPPYRPLYHLPSGVPVSGSVAGDTPSWIPNNQYTAGAIVFPSGPHNVLQASPPFLPGAIGQLPAGFPFYYRCTQIAGVGPSAGLSNATEPGWPQTDGVTVIDGNCIWQAVDNRKPLKAIKLQIRFLDTSSQQLRQVTIIQSLVD